jgi:FixJ family two-component response regulator
MKPAPVCIVDDEPAVCRALTRLLSAAGFVTAAFASPKEFLASEDWSTAGCLVLDLLMPGIDGLELQEALRRRGNFAPIIFLTGQADVPVCVRAMKGGAMDFLTKPVNDEELLAAVRRALERNRVTRGARHELDQIRSRLATLTPREREVLDHIVAGKLNKQVAADLGTVEQTIKVHRSRIMHKMKVASIAELARLAERLSIGATPQVSH